MPSKLVHDMKPDEWLAQTRNALYAPHTKASQALELLQNPTDERSEPEFQFPSTIYYSSKNKNYPVINGEERDLEEWMDMIDACKTRMDKDLEEVKVEVMSLREGKLEGDDDPVGTS